MSGLGLLALPYWKTFSIHSCVYGILVAPWFQFTIHHGPCQSIKRTGTGYHFSAWSSQISPNKPIINFPHCLLISDIINNISKHPRSSPFLSRVKETCPCPPKHPTRTCGLLGSVATEARCMACSIVKVSCVVAKCKAKKCWETWQVIFPQPRAGRQRLCGVTDQRCVGISWIPIIVAESWQNVARIINKFPTFTLSSWQQPKVFPSEDLGWSLLPDGNGPATHQRTKIHGATLAPQKTSIRHPMISTKKKTWLKFNDQRFLFTESL